MHEVEGIVKPGHQVASGFNGNPDYPGGTIRMQIPFFQTLGLDLTPYFPGTINLDISPHVFQPRQPKHYFKQLKWCDDPAENFSFFTCRLSHADSEYTGWVYWPAPETKPKHEQDVHTIELLMPQIAGLAYDEAVRVILDPDEGCFQSTSAAGR